MREQWPLVGRDEELVLIRSVLARPDRPGIILSGEAGTGKTRLALEAMVAARNDGLSIERVVASRAVATIPLGAFAPLLPPTTPTTDPFDRFRAAVAAITEKGEKTPVVLVVDDAHLLDDTSAALLHQVVVDGHARTIATIRSGEDVPEEIVGLWKDTDAERLELQPLSREETVALVRAALGGEVDGATGQRLWTASQGSPLVIRELVLGAVDAGTLRPSDGVWVLDGDLELPPSLAELVALRLRGLSDETSEVLDLLAVGDELGVAELQTRGDSVLLELERRNLLQMEEDGRRRPVRLTHPLYGEVLRTRLPQTREREIARSLADLLEEHGARRRGDVLRLASWRLMTGERLDGELLVDAARHSYAAGDFASAERLVRESLADGHDTESTLLLAQILHESGQHEAAEEVYASVDANVLDEPRRARAAVQRAVNLFFGLGRETEALEELATTQASLGGGAVADELTANRAWLNVVRAHPRDSLDLVASLRSSDADEVALMATVTTAWALAVTGRGDEARDAVSAAHDLRRRSGPTRLNRFRDFPELPHALSLLEDGLLAEAEEMILRGHEQSIAEQPMFVQAWWVLLAARHALLQGRARSATGWFRQGVAIQRRLHQPGFVRWNLAGLALAQATAGEIEEAALTLAGHDEIPTRPERLLETLSARARAWVAAESGDRSGARALLVGAADATARTGLVTFAAAALHDLVRLGDAADIADDLVTLAATSSGDLTRLRARHATAATADDGDALDAVATGFDAVGARLFAAEAYAQAGTAHSRAGDPRRAQRSRRSAKENAERCEGADTPALREIGEVVPLTPREREVTTLAASGISSKEIAERLYVSRRTVDNLLQRAYGKLGVSSRAEAAEALGVGQERGV